VAYIFQQDERKHRFVIGKDTRLSGYMFENALVAGICSMGEDAILVGPLPTPAIAFITRSLRADAGIMISASHNFFEDNGIKIFSPTGYKLPDPVEMKIEELILSGILDDIRPTGHGIGKAYRIDDAGGRYVEFVKNSVPKGMTFDHWKVVLDCANGASYKVAPAAFRELGAQLTILSDDPNGTNINAGCGSLYPENLAMIVKEQKADMGFAFDGDADRIIAVTETGEILDGDHLLAMSAIFLKEQNLLGTSPVVTTVMSNMGLDQVLKKHEIPLIKTQVGDRYVMEAMHESGALLGGEQSGHIIFHEYNSTGDGLITALQIMRMLTHKKQKLSELAKILVKFPQYIQNVRVSAKKPLEECLEIMQERKALETLLGDQGRIVMRYSGTEPIIRIMIESIQELNMKALTYPLVTAIKRHLNGEK
jgi:phosphoglucosamine mutase